MPSVLAAAAAAPAAVPAAAAPAAPAATDRLLLLLQVDGRGNGARGQRCGGGAVMR